MKALTALLFALFSVLPAHAASPSGLELNHMMQQSEASHSESGDFQAGAYEGYIMGVSDGLVGTSMYYYCPPVKINKKQLRGVVSKYLISHQRDLNVPAGALVAAALIETFPCKKKSQEPDWSELDEPIPPGK
jgi:hypothetical protein